MTIQHAEGMTDSQELEAKNILDLLDICYPGHPWSVRVMPGCVFVRHLLFGTNYGMNLKTSEADHDAAVMKKKIVLLAGEWLERAGLKRGQMDPLQEPTLVEGVPERFQAKEVKPKVEIQTVVVKEEQRTTPHPKAEKLINGE